MNRRVVIIQKYVPQYRVAFFNQLREKLALNGIELVLIYGQGSQIDKVKEDAIQLHWGAYVPVHIINNLLGSFYWQNASPYIQKNDLVIVEQANRILFNYYLLIRKKFRREIKVAFWGHGINRKLLNNSLANRFKLMIANTVDWWFAYTEGVKNMLIEVGIPAEKITNVQNTIDTHALLNIINQANQQISLPGFHPEDSVGIFVGSMYKEKQIPFVIEACKRIKEKVPAFHMIFIGSGSDKDLVEKFSQTHEWVLYLGPLFEKEKISYMNRADVLLMPRAVGLVVIDSFLAQTPIITTEHTSHGPEIEYIQNGYNGIITKETVEEYVEAVVKVLHDKEKLDYLKKGCKQSTQKYTLENMVNNFITGISSALK